MRVYLGFKIASASTHTDASDHLREKKREELLIQHIDFSLSLLSRLDFSYLSAVILKTASVYVATKARVSRYIIHTRDDNILSTDTLIIHTQVWMCVMYNRETHALVTLLASTRARIRVVYKSEILIPFSSRTKEEKKREREADAERVYTAFSEYIIHYTHTYTQNVCALHASVNEILITYSGENSTEVSPRSSTKT